MRRYYRYIEDTIVCVAVDEWILEHAYEKIISVLNSFTNVFERSAKSRNLYCFYIVQEKDRESFLTEDKFVVEDFDDDRWLLELINDLEDFYAKIFMCTVLHGSCMRLHNNNILLLGERWTGKTTLTYYLTTYCDGQYMADDCVYILNGKYCGFCTPLPIRNFQLEANKELQIIATTFDSDNVMRTMLCPPKTISSVDHIDIVVFPHFSIKGNNRVTNIAPSCAFQEIIKNVHSLNNMKRVYKDILKLASQTHTYIIEYQSSAWAYHMIQDCIK